MTDNDRIERLERAVSELHQRSETMTGRGGWKRPALAAIEAELADKDDDDE